MPQKDYYHSPNGGGVNSLKNWLLDAIDQNPTAAEALQLKITPDGRLKYHDGNKLRTLAVLTDLIGLGGSAINTEGLVLKVLLQTERTYYVRSSTNFGNSGETETDAFASIEEALIVLSNKYEISGHLILDMQGEYTLNCWYLPQFTGSGTLTFKGNDCTITFNAFQGSTQAYFTNWSGLSLNLENINFVKGACTKLNVEGGKMRFTNVDFGQLVIEFDNCRSTFLVDCQTDSNSSQLIGIRSTFELDRCKLIAQFKYCQLSLLRCTFYRAFNVEACSMILLNPRINFRWFTTTANIINSTLEFVSSWLTFENPGGTVQTKNFIVFQSCNLKDFPANIDVQGIRTFYDTAVVKLVNCQTPETFANVAYDFSKHTFQNGASAIELINTAILKDINIVGAPIKRDPFSILGNTNYDNSATGIPAETLQEAIDYIWAVSSLRDKSAEL